MQTARFCVIHIVDFLSVCLIRRSLFSQQAILGIVTSVRQLRLASHFLCRHDVLNRFPVASNLNPCFHAIITMAILDAHVFLCLHDLKCTFMLGLSSQSDRTMLLRWSLSIQTDTSAKFPRARCNG